MKEQRSKWNFSEYEHRVEMFKSTEGNEIRVDHLQKGNSNMGYIKFVNDSRGLTVFGDFGRWSFCRPFHPDADTFVSDGYWAEKLKIGSCQESSIYDGDRTYNELQELIDTGLEDYGYEGLELENHKEFLKSLQQYTDDEIEYTYEAYRNNSDFDLEMIPFCKTRIHQLEIVFDAFDEICKRLK